VGGLTDTTGLPDASVPDQNRQGQGLFAIFHTFSDILVQVPESLLLVTNVDSVGTTVRKIRNFRREKSPFECTTAGYHPQQS
jgi:hypothetical protein